VHQLVDKDFDDIKLHGTTVTNEKKMKRMNFLDPVATQFV